MSAPASPVPGTCETCRFWRSPAERLFAERDHKTYGVCDQGGSSYGNPDVEGTSAFAFDVKRYDSALLTLPCFGCVMHQKRT